jgi:hypothetical protein
MIVASAHTLTEGLTWHGLQIAPRGARPPREPPSGRRDVLVWRGERSLITLDDQTHLVFAFALEASNAGRLPAFPLLLHRFCEAARLRADGVARANFETGQSLEETLQVGSEALGIVGEDGERRVTSIADLHAPWRPGYFRLTAGDDTRIDGAAHFADAREADLSTADSGVDAGALGTATQMRTTRPDPLAPLAVLLVLALMLADWAVVARGVARR